MVLWLDAKSIALKMAKLPDEVTETINRLKQQALEVVESATATEFLLFDRFGETEETLLFLDELKTVSEDASASFSRFNTLQLQIARAQPTTTSDMIGRLRQAIARTQNRIPAWERSIQEVKMEWNLQ